MALPWVPKGAWLEERYVRCGKQCRCRGDQPHGTYWRLVWREKGRRKQRYVAAENVDAYAEALAERRAAGAARRLRRSRRPHGRHASSPAVSASN